MESQMQFPPQPGLAMLGWREWVGLPDLGLPPIRAKVDTGARTSALHAFSVEPFERDGQAWVRFSLHPLHKDDSEVRDCEAPLVDRREVSDSGGHRELRPVIRTRMCVGSVEFAAELTLTDRDSMSFRMLLGRTAMNGRFVVNPAASFLSGSQ